MLDTQNFMVFLAAGLLVNLIPGPDTLYVINGTLWILFVAWSSARVAAQLSLPRFARQFAHWLLGGLFIVFGIKLLRSQV